MKKRWLALCLGFVIPSFLYSQIDVGGIIKRKAEQRATQKVEQGVDKGLDKAEDGTKKSNDKNDNNSSGSNQGQSNENPTNNSKPQANGEPNSSSYKVYNNYDFVPGDKIIFEDDFSEDQDGEFPAHWDLIGGQGVVNKVEGKTAFALTDGNYGKIKPTMKNQNYLSDPFTVEFDFMIKDGSYAPQTFFKATDDDGRYISWNSTVSTGYFDPSLTAEYPGGNEHFTNTWHHAALAFKNGQMKCYVDQYRVLVIPKCGFIPEAIEFGGIGGLETPLIFTNVKVAQGGGMNMLGKILTDGKFVTHAITFDKNKSTIKPESMGFLNQMVKFLNENAGVKLEVDGHTDSDGDDASNLKLSQARADAVKSQLVTMGINTSRLTTKGFGETKPMNDNTTPEGKASNRRVEFVKL